MIYLDNAATTLRKPMEVEAAVLEAMRTCANAGRGGHAAAMAAADVLYQCRENAAKLFGVDAVERVIFTHNTTHALNIAINGIMNNGGHCVISGFEHNSVTRPLKALEEHGVSFTIAYSHLFCPQSTLQAIDDAIREDTVCVVCTYVSNVFGYKLPIAQIDELCYKKGISLIIDAAQAAGCIDLKLDDFKAVKCICMPGHKGLYGPQGTGLLLCADRVELPSLIRGGTGSLSGKIIQPDFLPDRHESGTHNVHGIAGLSRGIEYVLRVGVDKIESYEAGLIQKAADSLEGIAGVSVYRAKDPALQTGVLSFNISGMDSEEVAYLLSEQDIAVRGGLHCSPLAHESAGTSLGTVRMSVSWFNDEEEIEIFTRAVEGIANKTTL